MAQKLQEKSNNKSEFSERKRIDSEEAKKSERLNAISKKKEERLLEVKRDLEEKLRRRLIVKNSDLKKEAKEQERKFRNQKKSFNEKQMIQVDNNFILHSHVILNSYNIQTTISSLYLFFLSQNFYFVSRLKKKF